MTIDKSFPFPICLPGNHLQSLLYQEIERVWWLAIKQLQLLQPDRGKMAVAGVKVPLKNGQR